MSENQDLGQVLVIIPTYNELENIRLITERVRKAMPDAHILIADDNSPDGTGAVADELVGKDDHIHVLHRLGKEGLAAAYMAGFAWGLERGYGVLVEMDADGSHQPEQLPQLVAALADADLVLGSRWVPGGAVENWPLHRKILSRGGNLYTRVLLDVELKDATGGFRAFRASTLRALNLDEVASQGYCFQVDLARRVVAAGMKVVEVPITFVERTYGASKMSNKIVVEALWLVTVWGATERVDKARAALAKRRSKRQQSASEASSTPASAAAADPADPPASAPAAEVTPTPLPVPPLPLPEPIDPAPAPLPLPEPVDPAPQLAEPGGAHAAQA